MAGTRRLNPAELKARLQANLAVAGVKSSDPSNLTQVLSGDKNTNASEAPASSSGSLEVISATSLRYEALRPTSNEQVPPKSVEFRVPEAQTPARFVDVPQAEIATSAPTPRQADQSANPARKRAVTPPPIAAKRADRTVLHRRDQGAVLRGYRIPVDLHRQAERAKLGLASRRGSSMFWDELLQGAIDLLLDDTHRISVELSAARRSPAMGSPSTRVLQAAIRHDQDLRLRMLRIDLEEIDGATVRLEEIWTWLIRQVVKNEG
jgi:hypothetical protein